MYWLGGEVGQAQNTLFGSYNLLPLGKIMLTEIQLKTLDGKDFF